MVFTKNRGKKVTGRLPKNEEDKVVSNMNKEERREYNKQAKQKERECFDQSLAFSSSIEKDLEMTPSSGKNCSGKIYSSSTSTETTSNEPKKPGKRPLSEKTITPNTIKRRNSELYYEKVHTEKEIQLKDSVSSTRSSVAKVRWNMRLRNPANDPANEGDNNGPKSESASLESDEDTQLNDTQPENIQDSESNLTAIDTTPPPKKQIYRA